jgi:hypothetical protein
MKGGNAMRKSPTIQQGVVTELMAKLASLPKKEKDLDEPVSMSEMFRTKEYAAEIKAALKKGYTFENLAEIFSERCGVAVSARQMKYHFTRGKNQGMKSKSGRKAARIGGIGSRSSPADSPHTGKAKENHAVTESKAESSSKDSGFIFKNGVTTYAEGNAKPGAFSINAKPKES